MDSIDAVLRAHRAHCVAMTLEHEELTGAVIGSAMTVHRVFGPGFVESIYKNALAIELRKRGLQFEREKRITVRYEGETVGRFSSDFLVAGKVIAEVKAMRTINAEHEKQLVHYLSATGIDIGLLLNFGAPRLEFRRKTRIYVPRSGLSDGQEDCRRQDGQDEQDGQDGGREG